MPTQFGGNWGRNAQQDENSFYTDSDSSDFSEEEEERANVEDMDHEEDPAQLNSDSEHEVPLRPDELEERRRQVEERDFNDDLDIDNVATIQHNLVASGADVGVGPPLDVGRQSPGN